MHEISEVGTCIGSERKFAQRFLKHQILAVLGGSGNSGSTQVDTAVNTVGAPLSS